jgi:predicted dehydrogenase
VTVEDGRIARADLRSGRAVRSPGADRGAAADPGGLDAAVHAAQLADLLASVDEGREPAVSGASGREALEIVCAVYESSRTGRPVSVGR